MKKRSDTNTKILVIDVGGSNVKCVATDHKTPVKIKSGPKLTPGGMVRQVLEATSGWHFDAVAIGYPGVVRRGQVVHEPHNLGPGWSASISRRRSVVRSRPSTTRRCRRWEVMKVERCCSSG